MKNTGFTSSKTVLVTFLLGLMSSGWNMLVVPVAQTRGYVDVSSASFFAAMFGPFLLSIYAVSVLSGSKSWYGSMIGDKQQSFDRLRRYMGVWILGGSLTGLAVSGFRLLTSESFQKIHIYASAGFLLGVLASLWAPRIGVLRHG